MKISCMCTFKYPPYFPPYFIHHHGLGGEGGTNIRLLKLKKGVPGDRRPYYTNKLVLLTQTGSLLSTIHRYANIGVVL
jgi:hypothetical protein